MSDERADAIPEAALNAAVDALLADSGLPQYGGHRATVERRQRLAFAAAAPHMAGSREAERLTEQLREATASEAACGRDLAEAHAEIERLRAAQPDAERASQPEPRQDEQ